MRQNDSSQPYEPPRIQQITEAEMEWKAWLDLIEWKEQHGK